MISTRNRRYGEKKRQLWVLTSRRNKGSEQDKKEKRGGNKKKVRKAGDTLIYTSQ